MRTGARGIPKPISTSGQTEMNSMCGLRRATNLSCTIPPLYRQGSKPMHLLMTIVGFGKLVNGISPIARTIPLSIPAKIKLVDRI